MVRRAPLTSVCALLLWFGGCPKRQATRSVLVYIPAPAPAAAPSAAKSDVLVIEEPAPPPAPEEIQPPPTPQPSVRRRRPVPARSSRPSEPGATAEPAQPAAPPAEVPALEPRESSAQEAELRRQLLSTQQDIRQRLGRLDSSHLSDNGRKALDDARAFFAQSNQALADGDVQRALNLARKASLLLAALE